MALNGIQIFKMTPKKNCKECGCPTCMAFSMKVAQGAIGYFRLSAYVSGCAGCAV